jgi:D-lactate dehydrogenase
MRIVVFSTEPYDREYLSRANRAGHNLTFFEARLTPESASMAADAEAVCAFVNDDLSAPVIQQLAAQGVRLIVLRSAGFNNVDLPAARTAGMAVGRVPAYSPHAVAEHAVALMLTLNRRTHRAYSRVREGNFELDGLLGFDMHKKTVGIVGTGRIGAVLAGILAGFGCELLAYDPIENPECLALGVRYVTLPALLAQSDVISLQCPLTPQTHHLIDASAIAAMKPGVMIINTSRGAVIDTQALIPALKSGHIGALGLDVYEEEAELFFHDFSATFIPDDVLARLLSFHNVLITGHQAFFTREALTTIAETTMSNIDTYIRTGEPLHRVGD